MMEGMDCLFTAASPLGFTVEVARSRWTLITTVKHPAMAGCADDVRRAIEEPEQIRRRRTDPDVYLCHWRRRSDRWVCAVVKMTGLTGFLITAYPTDAVKEGGIIWQS